MTEEELTQETGVQDTKAEETEPKPEETEGKISCDLKDFQLKICRPQRTAVVFLGKGAENIDNILGALDELQGSLDLDIGVLDLAAEDCGGLSDKYSIDREATQLLVFQNCEKISGISLEGDYKERIAMLKQSLERLKETSGEAAES